MKPKTQLVIAALAVAISSSVCSAALPAALPEFKSKAEIQRTAPAQQQSAAGSAKGEFYTGKPYEADREGYLFKYRNYDPELSRWSSNDPSGFPDGANNGIYIDNSPVRYIDIAGLAKGDPVSGVYIKRNNIDLLGDDKYGHWWIALDNESYGWWPRDPVGLLDTLLGVPGELNGQTNFHGTATTDPHNADAGAEHWQAIHLDDKTDDEVKGLIRQFANGYSGDWSWPTGQNCHSFQTALMAASFIE